jgi:Eukaryotic aspartyl protease
MNNSFQNLTDYKTSDIATDGGIDGFFGQDVIHLYTHYFQSDPAWDTPVPNFPIRVATNGSTFPDHLGLGYGSTILQRLFNTGLIASRSFSLYIGTGMERAGGVINGSVTLGGYDSARFTGTVHNYTVGRGEYPFGVHVTDIIINNPDGSNQSLFDRSKFSNLPSTFTGFDAKISTEQYPMVFPDEVTKNFMSYLNAEPSDHPDGSLQLKDTFHGSMSIVLDDGFSVTLPKEILCNVTNLTPVAAITPSTVGTNNTAKGDDSQPYLLTTAWLTQVYMMVNYDADQTGTFFHLAEAVQTAPYIIPKTTCPRVAVAEYVPPQRSFMSAGLAGAIVGGVIGGLALITLLVVAGLKWRRIAAQRQAASEVEKGQRGGGIEMTNSERKGDTGSESEEDSSEGGSKREAPGRAI